MTPLPPRFKVLKESFGVSPAYRLTDSRTGDYVVILPNFGGAITQVALRTKNELVELLDGYASFDDAMANLGSSFKGCNLFPFPNRIAGGTYFFDAKPHQLVKNFPLENNAIHGLVFDRKFETIRITAGEQSCLLTLGFSPSTEEPGYPFSYSLEHDYCLSTADGFTCTTRITNRSDTAIPVGHGWHPYFTAGAESINELLLRIPRHRIYEVDGRNIPTGRTRKDEDFEQSRPLGKTAFDSCFWLDGSGGLAEIELNNRQKQLKLRIWQETGPQKYNYLQVYTPPARRSIAIEPMSCAPDAFNNGDGLIRLEPNTIISLSWGVYLAR